MTDRPRVSPRAIAVLWFVAAAASAIAAVIRFRNGESGWFNAVMALVMVFLGVRYLRRSPAAGS